MGGLSMSINSKGMGSYHFERPSTTTIVREGTWQAAHAERFGRHVQIIKPETAPNEPTSHGDTISTPGFVTTVDEELRGEV